MERGAVGPARIHRCGILGLLRSSGEDGADGYLDCCLAAATAVGWAHGVVRHADVRVLPRRGPGNRRDLPGVPRVEHRRGSLTRCALGSGLDRAER